MKLSKRKLQTALNKLAQARNEAFRQRTLIHDHCISVYGFDPADIDNDLFIDACDGGCGESEGMTVDEFEKSMIGE